VYLEEYIEKLRKNELTGTEYKSLEIQCLRLVRKACNRYCINDILSNPSIKQDIYGQVYLKSLMKSLKGYDKNKGAFSTYFFYKACSGARNEVGKLKRRFKLNNVCSLDETFYDESTKT